jgi:hypothetical protein
MRVFIHCSLLRVCWIISSINLIDSYSALFVDKDHCGLSFHWSLKSNKPRTSLLAGQPTMYIYLTTTVSPISLFILIASSFCSIHVLLVRTFNMYSTTIFDRGVISQDSDNWEMMGDGVWGDTYYDDPKVEADTSTAKHRLKHGILEDGYNKVCNVLLLLLLFVYHYHLSKLPFLSFLLLLLLLS